MKLQTIQDSGKLIIEDGLDDEITADIVFAKFIEVLAKNLDKSKLPITYEKDIIEQTGKGFIGGFFIKQSDEGFVIKHKDFTIVLIYSSMGVNFVIDILVNCVSVNMQQAMGEMGKQKQAKLAEENFMLMEMINSIIKKTHSQVCSGEE